MTTAALSIPVTRTTKPRFSESLRDTAAFGAVFSDHVLVAEYADGRWGDPAIVSSRLGSAVRDIVFDRDTMIAPALSVQHSRDLVERTVGPVMKVVATLGASDPGRLASFRAEYDALTAEYLTNNAVHQGFLLTRAVKM